MHRNLQPLLNNFQRGILRKYENTLERVFFALTSIKPLFDDDGLKNLVVELDFNFNIEEVFRITEICLEKPFAHQKISHSLGLFQELIRNLESEFKNEFEISEISLYFKETTIHIHSIKEIHLLDNLMSILKSLIHHYGYLSKVKGSPSSIIHIPVVAEELNVKSMRESKHLIPCSSPYEKYWGVSIGSRAKSYIYDVRHSNLISGDLEFDWCIILNSSFINPKRQPSK